VRALFFVMFCSGCGAGGVPADHLKPAVWQTRCGLKFQDAVNAGDYTLENVQGIEDLAISMGLVSCTNIKGYALIVRPDVWTLPEDPRKRSGSAFCNTLYPRIEVAEPFWGPQSNALAHELHHVEQRCASTFPVDQGSDETHGDWYRSGAYKKLSEIDSFIINTYYSKKDGGQ